MFETFVIYYLSAMSAEKTQIFSQKCMKNNEKTLI
jgi:hypothetical protein